MRSNQNYSQRIQNTSMRSPSPDLSNRNIIKDTKIPIDDVKRYLQKSEISKSPKASQQTRFNPFDTDHQLQHFQHRIAQLQKKQKLLLQQNEQYRCALQYKATYQNQLIHQNQLKQDRISSIQKQLKEKQKIIQLQSTKLNALSIPIGPTQALLNLQSNSQDLVNIVKSYQNNIERDIDKWGKQCENKIKDLAIRIYKIQQFCLHLHKQISKKYQNVLPSRGERARKINQQPLSQYGSGIHLPQSGKPFDSMTMRYGVRQWQSKRQLDQLNNKDHELKNNKLEYENENLRKKIGELNRKVGELVEEMNSRGLGISGLERELRSLKQDNARLKERTAKQQFLYENEKNTLKKSFELQKQKCEQLSQNINKINQKCVIYENKMKQKDITYQQIKQQLKRQYEMREINIKKYYQDLYTEKEKNINNQLCQCLEVLNSIRKDVEGNNMDQVMRELQKAISEKALLQKQIISAKDENQHVFSQLKAKLIQQQQQLIQLQKQNILLAQHLKCQQIQRQKLKKTMLQFEVYKLAQVNMVMSMGPIKLDKGFRNKNQFEEILKKIDHLQLQITGIMQK